MKITVQIRLDIARELQVQSSSEEGMNSPAASKILNLASEFGVSLEPIHPGIDDPWLLPFFMIEVDDAVLAQRLIPCLLELDEVEAAYLKPMDAPP